MKINCYFSTRKHLAYRKTFKEASAVKHSRAFKGYYCSNYYTKKTKTKQNNYEKHIKSCSGVPGILYNFNTENVVSFEDILKCKDGLLFVAYCDLETITSSDYLLDPENRNMFPVS